MLGGVGRAVETYWPLLPPPPMFMPMVCGAANVCPECFKEEEEEEEEVTGVTDTEPVVSYRMAAAPPIMCAWLYQSARWVGLKSPAAAAGVCMGVAAAAAAVTALCWWW